MIKVEKNKVIADFSIFEEFCASVDKAITTKSNIFLSYDGSSFTLFSEGVADGKSGGATVKVVLPVSAANLPFSATVDATRFLALFKRLYEGDITLNFTKTKLNIEKDNIKASLPVKSFKQRHNNPKHSEIVGPQKDWIVDSLLDSLSSISETGKVNQTGKLAGILFDNSGGFSRICKFSTMSLFLSCSHAMFGSDYRTIIPDEIAKLTKSFKKSIDAILIADNHIGLRLEQGTVIFAAKPHDTYPLEYIKYLNLENDMNMIPKDAEAYQFSRDSLVNAIDLIATSLGETDSWVSFEVVARNQSDTGLVWKLEGKTYNGMVVAEEVESSDGKVLLPFGVNKTRALKALPMFDETVFVYNLSASILAFTNEAGDRCALMTKARI